MKNVGYPISLSRGAYWLARTYEIMDNKELSEKWFAEGAKYLTTYYGQLSFLKIYPNKKFELNNLMEIDKKIAENFYNKKISCNCLLIK